jgi:hypothetical protein
MRYHQQATSASSKEKEEISIREMILKNRKYGNKFKYRHRAYRKRDITM